MPCLISICGKTAPTRATITLNPARALGAPGHAAHESAGLFGRLLDHSHALDDHWLLRDVLMGTEGTGLHLGDLVHNIHAVRHLAENGVAVRARIWSLVVEEPVVNQVDEELARGGVHDHRAGHGDGAALVGESVRGLVLDGRVRLLLLHGRREAAALDHEAVDHAVEDGAVVVARLRVVDEVIHRDWRLGVVKLQGDLAHGRFYRCFFHFRGSWLVVSG